MMFQVVIIYVVVRVQLLVVMEELYVVNVALCHWLHMQLINLISFESSHVYLFSLGRKVLSNLCYLNLKSYWFIHKFRTSPCSQSCDACIFDSFLYKRQLETMCRRKPVTNFICYKMVSEYSMASLLQYLNGNRFSYSVQSVQHILLQTLQLM